MPGVARHDEWGTIDWRSASAGGDVGTIDLPSAPSKEKLGTIDSLSGSWSIECVPQRFDGGSRDVRIGTINVPSVPRPLKRVARRVERRPRRDVWGVIDSPGGTIDLPGGAANS